MPLSFWRFPGRRGQRSMPLVVDVTADRSRWIAKGQLWSNRPQTRANAGAWQVDVQNDGKNLRSSVQCLANQQLRRLVDD